MITNRKLNLVSLASAALILFLILFSSTASAATATCSVKSINYQYWSDEQYPLIDLFGEKYVPVRDNVDQIWESHIDKLVKLVNDSKGSYSLMMGESLDLGQGYSFQIKQVDVDGQKVWIEFDKDGQYVNDQIISTNSGENTWTCTLDNIQGVNNVSVLKVHVNQIFQDVTGSIVKIDGIWLIDYANPKTLQIGDKFGDYTLKSIVNGVYAYNLGSLVFDYGVTITDLGTLYGGNYSCARGINNNGQIAGYSGTGPHAFLWKNGVMTDLGTLPVLYMDEYSYALGINDKGQIVGESSEQGESGCAVLWQNGTINFLGGGGYYSMTATGINDNGQIVGYQHDTVSGDNTYAIIWKNGMVNDLGTLGGDFSYARGINDKGQVVGESDTELDEVTDTYDRHAFLWQNDVMTDLGTLPGGSNSCAYGINNNGQVVGSSDAQSGENHAFLWQNSVITDLGTLPGGSGSCATGINDKGQIVGFSDTQTGENHAVLWQNGVIIDLGTLPGGPNSKAYGINEIGQIVGESSTKIGESYVTHATLWTLPTSSTKPVANFTSNVTSGTEPLTVLFTDKSTNNPTSWKWTFGDGTNSNVKNPIHKYSVKGNYTVSLTVSNTAGSNTATKTNYIKVLAVVKPVANFTSNVTSGYAPLSVAFADKSTNNPTAWRWTFGDGTNSTSKNPIHRYSTAGNYTVTLTASDSAGSRTTTKTNYIKVIKGKTIFPKANKP